MAVWLALGRPPLAWLVITSFVEGSLFVFFQLSEGAALPQIVPKAQLPQAIAQNQARQQGAGLVGSPIGGALYGLSRLLPFAADAVSYAVSFVSLLFVRPAFQGERLPRERNLRRDVSVGLAWLWRERFLPRVQRRFSPQVVVLGSLWIWPVQTAALFLIPSPLALGILTAAGFVAGPIFNVVVGAYRYALVPESLYGRVASASLLFAWGSIPLGSLFAGYGIAAWGARPMLLLLAAILLVIALAATASRDVRTARPPEELSPASMKA